jgi:hypothetical protein
LCPISRAGSNGRCNTIHRVDSIMQRGRHLLCNQARIWLGRLLIPIDLSSDFKNSKSVSSVGLVNSLLLSKYEPYCIPTLSFFPTVARRNSSEDRLLIP